MARLSSVTIGWYTSRELAALDGEVQVALELKPFERRRVHALVEDGVLRLAAALERYIARSALRSRLSASFSPARSRCAMPMLAVVNTSWPPRLIGARSDFGDAFGDARRPRQGQRSRRAGS